MHKKIEHETKMMITATVIVIAIVLVVILLLPHFRYNKANEMRSINKLEEARDIYISLGDYKDSRELMHIITYDLAENYARELDLDRAVELMNSIHDDFEKANKLEKWMNDRVTVVDIYIESVRKSQEKNDEKKNE